MAQANLSPLPKRTRLAEKDDLADQTKEKDAPDYPPSIPKKQRPAPCDDVKETKESTSGGSRDFQSAITITFGDRAENHHGMQLLGDLATSGFSLQDLKDSMARFEKQGYKCELIALKEALNGSPGALKQADEAYVLVIRSGVTALLKTGSGANPTADALYAEQVKLDPDKKALMRGRVVNKRARYNLCFGEEKQTADFAQGKGTVVAYSAVPLLQQLRQRMVDFFPSSGKLWGEGNYYYDPKSCGIGFHGDGERRKVIALRLGASIPLHYQWFQHSRPVGKRVVIVLNHGDMYMMSEKAVGHDWKRPSQLTLRHAAGCEAYTTIKAKKG